MIADKIKIYNRKNDTRLKIKAVFFDMDGIIFDSMPYHAQAWVYALDCFGMPFTPYEAYMNEGRTGSATIDTVFQNVLGREATEEEKKKIYKFKTDKFDELNTITPMAGVFDLLKKVKAQGLQIYVVTGSAQESLLSNFDKHFPGIFDHKKMVTANDVTIGKPNPEPYLKALEKAKLQPFEAVVIENAPLGIESSVAAGIFTIAVNTGVLEDVLLEKSGANIVYPTINDLSRRWEELYECVK